MDSIMPLAGLYAIGGGVLYLLYLRGVFSSSAFDRAPGRQGPMTLADPLIGLGMMIATTLVAAVIFRRAGLLPAEGEPISSQQLLVMMALSQVGLLPPALYALFRLSQGRPEPPKLRLLRSFGFGLLGFLAIAPILGVVMHLVTAISTAAGHPPPQVAHVVLTQLMDPELSPAVRWGFILSAVIGAPALEEIVFRGLLQSSIVQSGFLRSRWTAIVITSVIFTFIHFSAAAPQALVLLYVLSLALGYVYERTGSLIAPITLHATFNAMQILAVSMMDPAQQP